MRRRALPSRRRPQLGRGSVRGRAGRSLVVADDDLRALLNRLPAMVGYWDAALRNRMANDAYREYFGLTPQQMRGIHIKDVLGPELFAKNQPYMLRALAGEAQLFDVTIVDTAKRTRHAQASYIPDIVDGKPRGFFVLLTDITSRRENEQALEAAEARFRTLFEFAPIGTYLADDKGRILDVNPAGAELLGASARRWWAARSATSRTPMTARAAGNSSRVSSEVRSTPTAWTSATCTRTGTRSGPSST